MIKCCICHKGPAQGVSVFRINAKGVTGIWACEEHVNKTDAHPIDPELKEIVDAITEKLT